MAKIIVKKIWCDAVVMEAVTLGELRNRLDAKRMVLVVNNTPKHDDYVFLHGDYVSVLECSKC